MAMTIEPVTAFAARRQRKQADFLIISDRFDVAPGALRHDADWQPRRRVLQTFPIHARIPLEPVGTRSEEHTSELQSLMRISYAVFCLKKKNTTIRSHE